MNRAMEHTTRDRELSCTESLLLAQAVYEHGHNWPSIAHLLQKHSLIGRPEGFYTQDACQSLYEKMLDDAGVHLDEKKGPKSKQSETIARQYYAARVNELRDLIAAEEARFKQLALEIEEIRSGAWDDKIAKEFKTLLTEHETNEAAAVTDDEADSRQVQSEITQAVEVVASPAAEREQMDVDTAPAAKSPSETRLPSVAEGDSSGEEVGKGRGGASRRGRSKAKSPAIRRRRRLSQVTPPPVPHENEHEAKKSPLRKSHGLSIEQAEAEPEEEVEAAEASPAPPTNRRASKRKASSVETPTTSRDAKRAREESEPSIIEEEEDNSSIARQKRAAFQQTILLLHNQFHNHRHGAIFHAQVKDTDADNYKDIVKRPMDLKTIRAKVKEGVITNSDEYLRDIYLMFANALLYNAPGTTTHEHAKSMLADLETAIHDHKMSESFNKK